MGLSNGPKPLSTGRGNRARTGAEPISEDHMSIKVGDRIPSVKLKQLGESGMQEVSTDDLFKGKKVVVFSVPGAFTPTCSAKHLPGFVEKASEFKAKGVDEIVCMAVNDPFVMKAWGT